MDIIKIFEENFVALNFANNEGNLNMREEGMRGGYTTFVITTEN